MQGQVGEDSPESFFSSSCHSKECATIMAISPEYMEEKIYSLENEVDRLEREVKELREELKIQQKKNEILHNTLDRLLKLSPPRLM